jgi:hypothetical protein
MNIGGRRANSMSPPIFIGFRTDEYNLNTFIGTNKFKITDK